MVKNHNFLTIEALGTRDGVVLVHPCQTVGVKRCRFSRAQGSDRSVSFRAQDLAVRNSMDPRTRVVLAQPHNSALVFQSANC